jgi:hypothetical protein
VACLNERRGKKNRGGGKGIGFLCLGFPTLERDVSRTRGHDDHSLVSHGVRVSVKSIEIREKESARCNRFRGKADPESMSIHERE